MIDAEWDRDVEVSASPPAEIGQSLGTINE